jgi:urease accessory protein
MSDARSPRSLPSSLTVAMLLADARLPSGGHAHSAGLEPALMGGLRPADVARYIEGRARTTTLVEAGTAVVARHRFLTAPTPERQDDVVAHWGARTPSAAQRDASRLLGRGYLRLAQRTWGTDPAVVACAAVASPPRPVVVGAIAAATLLDPEDLVRLFVYEDAQAAAAALLKLEPTDPAVPVTWVLEACAAVDDLVPSIAALTDPADVPAGGAPQAEGWAESHALMTQRLFRA